MRTTRFTPWTALTLLKTACRKKTRCSSEKIVAVAFAKSCHRYFMKQGWTTTMGAKKTTRKATTKKPRTWSKAKQASMYASPTYKTLAGYYGPTTKYTYHFQCVTPNGRATATSWAVAQCVGQCMKSLYGGYQPYGMVWVNGTTTGSSRGTWQTYVNKLWTNEGIFLTISVGGKSWIHPKKTSRSTMAKAA